jgi:hypothetical protein
VHRSGDERAWWQQAGIDPIKRRVEWDDGRLNDRHYLGRMALPRSLTQGTRK